MYTIRYSYIMSTKEPFNRNMLPRKDSTHTYIRIKEQKQKKYDNNITIIIYNKLNYIDIK